MNGFEPGSATPAGLTAHGQRRWLRHTVRGSVQGQNEFFRIAFDGVQGARMSVGGPSADKVFPRVPTRGARDIHRIGGGQLDNLRLKLAETRLNPAGISVLKAATPAAASRQMRKAFPRADQLHALARIVGSTNEELIRAAEFDLVPDPTKKFPNHYRITHGGGVPGFHDVNLVQLSLAFENTMVEG